MTRTPIPNCPQPETPIRDRAWTDEQRHAMFKYTADEVRTRFETWTSAQPWFKATIGFGRSGDEYADPCINSRWQGWWAAYAERIAADEGAVTDGVVRRAAIAHRANDTMMRGWQPDDRDLGRMRAALLAVWPNPHAPSAQVDAMPEIRAWLADYADELDEQGSTDVAATIRTTVASLTTVTTAEPVAQGEFDAEARSHARMIHDFPRLSVFFQKHALGSKLPASCFACGHVGERAITHAELADIYVCKTCAERIAKSPAKSAEPSTHPTTNSPEIDSKLVGGAVAQVRHFDYRGVAGHGFSQEAQMLDGAPVLPDGTLLYTTPPAQPRAVPDGWALVPESFVKAASNYVQCANSGGRLSPYIKENGLHGGSPWAEFVDEHTAMLDAPSPGESA